MTLINPTGSRITGLSFSRVFRQSRRASPNIDRPDEETKAAAVIVNCSPTTGQASSSQRWDEAFPQSENSWKQVLLSKDAYPLIFQRLASVWSAGMSDASGDG